MEDLCRRGVFREDGGVYRTAVDLFATWLTETGFARLVSDQLGDELAEARRQREDAAYVQAAEIVDLTDRWELYQGRSVTPEDVRGWLEQVESHVDQRMLFKLLQNVRFIRDIEVREMFVRAQDWMRSRLSVPVRKSRAQRRDDILVCYADGGGKSGAYYAALYAKANDISGDNVRALGKVAEDVGSWEKGKQLGVVIVDDIVGTGRTMLENLEALAGVQGGRRVGVDVPLSVVAVCGTSEGERRLRSYLQKSMPSADLEVCEQLMERHFAFGDGIGLWETEDEKHAAKSLVTGLGVRIQRRKPLGYGDQGLLVTFARNCPNNSLPILHGSGKGRTPWRALFPRSKA